MSMNAQQVHRAIVKQVISGDTLVLRGQPKGGPPPEKTVCLSNIQAPKLARRANPNTSGSVETKDEPYAWEAREYLRKKVIGREVGFYLEYKVPGTGREYGVVFLGKDKDGENLTEALVAEGLADVRRMGLKKDDSDQQKLVQLEEAARASGKGKHGVDASAHVRDIKWILESPRNFVDSHHNKPLEAVVEHVRDGCTVRAFLLPSFEYVTVMLSGIKCPMFKTDSDGKQVSEPYAEECRYFTESRLLQRDVKIILEGVSNQNFLGSVLHPNGNIAELLLREGFARCVDWSIGVVTQGADKYRIAENCVATQGYKYVNPWLPPKDPPAVIEKNSPSQVAKEKKLRIWKDYSPPSSMVEVKDKSFVGKVVEVINGDGLVVKISDGMFKKIFLASIRPPRLLTDNTENGTVSKEASKRHRPLYDVPYMFEAREFLRKKLIGKKVNVEVDYIQPANQSFPEKMCCSVTIGGINIAEALVSKGLATVIRYKQDDDQRSSHYDELMAAEARAQKKCVGIFSKKEAPIHRVADIAGDVPKAKQFLPFLQRAGRSEAVVEFVASGSRLRLFLPRETCLITFLISGIDCPRGTRQVQGGQTMAGDPFGEEALLFTKELCLQHEVEVEVEAIDKGGNFIGWLFVDGINLSVALVEAGLAKVHFTAERSSHYTTLMKAQEQAKIERRKIWATFEETKEEVVVEEPLERQITYHKVIITEVTNQFTFFAQNVENGPQLEKMMDELRKEMESNPPLPGSYTPKRGDLCAAKFSGDSQWYRAKLLKVESGKATIIFIDFGNKEDTLITNIAALPSAFRVMAPQAVEYALAGIGLPPDEDAKQEAVDALFNDIMNRHLLLNKEYKGISVDCATLVADDGDQKSDIGEMLLTNGFVLVDNRKEKRLAKLMADYHRAQESAKKERMNIWRYGDFTEDDAKEFGYSR